MFRSHSRRFFGPYGIGNEYIGYTIGVHPDWPRPDRARSHISPVSFAPVRSTCSPVIRSSNFALPVELIFSIYWLSLFCGRNYGAPFIIYIRSTFMGGVEQCMDNFMGVEQLEQCMDNCALSIPFDMLYSPL